MTHIVYAGPNLWAETMANSPDADNRSSIRKRIEEARGQLDPKKSEAGPVSNLHAVWRMVIDLVAGTGFGAALGYGLDVLFGTLPIFLGVLTFARLCRWRSTDDQDGAGGAGRDGVPA